MHIMLPRALKNRGVSGTTGLGAEPIVTAGDKAPEAVQYMKNYSV